MVAMHGALPSTQPRLSDTKVTDFGTNPMGTGPIGSCGNGVGVGATVAAGVGLGGDKVACGVTLGVARCDGVRAGAVHAARRMLTPSASPVTLSLPWRPIRECTAPMPRWRPELPHLSDVAPAQELPVLVQR